ncbi:NAD(P)/FAD-dependent oxidoreductase [Amycolatopsis jiangsuensis]|uniref:NADPH-dependent 2,4-dienoyl-CoA reductase/sulfur reductase-like enzyme n=1 Tax=Amycolatopsis jiangsuensis TaxID=1181879 RepID=A0A840J867_9PSEU|nr:FAD/NAD(P)-binding oxidoreductase [Amycolatopsis jiangsuensis]MBB4689567.1 NADPH-dependent 2,4-dienoyl-CoA reductase/sulfur reductase-like enzyme [Amycolatopsis jiangsuensis]
MTTEDVVVVGASVAGVRFAQTLRRRDFRGRIRLMDADPGLPYDKPPLSKEVLTANGSVEPASLVEADQLAALRIELIRGCHAQALDIAGRTLRTSYGTLAFGTAVIATGATARRLDLFTGMAGVHYLRSRTDAASLRRTLETTRRLVVVGGGFIGGEVASSARKRGIDVTIVEAAPRLFSRVLPVKVADEAAALHQANGVALRFGTTVVEAHGKGRVEHLVLSDGSTLDADAVVVGVGTHPATGWLTGSGLHLDDGVVCEPDLSARGAEGVFAIGDVARWHDLVTGSHHRLEHWTAAREQAALVASNLASGRRKPFSTVGYVWSDQHGVHIQHAGGSGSRTTVERAGGRGRLFLHHDETGPVGATGFDAQHAFTAIRLKLAQRLAAAN